ncbi:MAG: hypothetical protein HN368_13280 [Spirochaetales bacterium]|jgi:hypothetical protein|nr:hypothetical protein [Spirochaetales bacterium]
MEREKFCQSCGMPAKMDPKGGGLEKDGTANSQYCSYCYDEGSFTQPDFNAKQMQDFCKEKIKEQGSSRFSAWLFTRSIPSLKRWKG